MRSASDSKHETGGRNDGNRPATADASGRITGEATRSALPGPADRWPPQGEKKASHGPMAAGASPPIRRPN